eukprot:scaffold1311_cov256-Pinguiococcus_pyrenoidosus.AAC.14
MAWHKCLRDRLDSHTSFTLPQVACLTVDWLGRCLGQLKRERRGGKRFSRCFGARMMQRSGIDRGDRSIMDYRCAVIDHCLVLAMMPSRCPPSHPYDKSKQATTALSTFHFISFLLDYAMITRDRRFSGNDHFCTAAIKNVEERD